MARVVLEGVSKTYESTPVLHGIDLHIDDGEFVVFVGPSGCGKSTLLRLIAGLEDITDGTISIGERIINEIAPSRRQVAMVFQTYALYPHMTIYNNMAFGLKQAKLDKDIIDARVRKAAETLRITDYLHRTPRALSGGQRQRVAIGRAIVREPEVFLFDEPLSNLDAALRAQTRLEIARLHKRLGTTMIYVTHDQVEAMTLADKIVVLRDGAIEQVGKPLDLYQKPRNVFVAQFIGSPQMNFFQPCDLMVSMRDRVHLLDESFCIGIRPENLKPCDKDDAIVGGHFELLEQLGEYVLLHMICESGKDYIVKAEKSVDLEKGAQLYFSAAIENLHFFCQDTQTRIKY